MIGRTISHYQILDKLGEGGMGVVWKARDTLLHRAVAIKVLPAGFCSDQSRVLRFEREARAAASVSHSGIAAVYDTGNHDGVPYIVYEFVEGHTLRTVLSEGPLPPSRVVSVATQLADALSAAHHAGFAHRDLKPENIMITRHWHASILDFGLARQIFAGAAGQRTATISLTLDGTVVGTPAYMSPEQVRGEESDHRSDIFSLGLVMHEMLSGARTFDRASAAETMTAIIRDDPPPLPATVSPGLAAIVMHCLEKEPGHRFQSAQDLAFDLRSASGTSVAALVPPSPGVRRRRGLAGAFVAVGVLAGIGLGAWLADSPGIDVSRHHYTPVAVGSFTRAIGEGGGTGANLPMWSPDGKSIVYSADGVRVQRIDGYDSVRLTRQGFNAFFSPDGSRIYFSIAGAQPRELWSISVAGGTPERVLSDLGGFGPILDGIASSRDGKALAIVRAVKPASDEMSVWISSPPGSQPRPYPGSPTGRALHRAHLRFSPDGSKLLLTLAPYGQSVQWWLLRWPPPANVEPGTVRRLFEEGHSGEFGSSGDWLSDNRHIVVALHREGELGGPLWIADTATGEWKRMTPEPFACTRPTVSRDGRVLFHMAKRDEHSVEIPLDGSAIRPLIAGLRQEHSPSWSPAGEQVLFVTNQRGEQEIWLANRRDGTQRPVVTQQDFPPGSGLRQFLCPVFSPDGTRIAYTSQGAIWISPLAGGAPVRIHDGYCATWSPDGAWLAYIDNPRGTTTTLMKLQVGRPQEATPVCSSAQRWLAQWSPDGRWITAQLPDGFGVISPDGLRSRVLFKGTLDWGSACGWSRDASTLFVAYLTPEGRVLSGFDVATGVEHRIRDLGPVHFSYYAYYSTGLSPSPDGKSLASSTLNVRFEPWVLDGLDPPRSLWARMFRR